MNRRILLVCLFVGALVALLLGARQQGWVERPVAAKAASLTATHSPAMPMAMSVSRDDDDKPCEEDEEEGFRDPRVRRGFRLAPVPLNLEHKNCKLVGLGSYLVNAGNCNDCHSKGPATQFVTGGNPFFGQPKQVNPATYLGGGRNFGKLANSGPNAPDIISRNLTPSKKTGLPEGDHTFEEFLEILRTGKDFDHLHPHCSATITTNCLAGPYDGDLLQIMPWPNTQELTKRDIRAIYEYLRAIPCIQGNDPGDPADRCQ